jgi:hypothetical protein
MFSKNEEEILELLVKTEKAYDDLGEPGFSDINMSDLFDLFPEMTAQSVVGILGSIIRKDYVYASDGIYYLTAKARTHYNMEEA